MVDAMNTFFDQMKEKKSHSKAAAWTKCRKKTNRMKKELIETEKKSMKKYVDWMKKCARTHVSCTIRWSINYEYKTTDKMTNEGIFKWNGKQQQRHNSWKE